MIDPETGMKPGERYSVESLERAHQFPGFFLDGKYYLGPELLTAIGWLEGSDFHYDNLDPAGEPIFPGGVAGSIHGLVLTMADGVSLRLTELAASSFVGSKDADLDEQASRTREPDHSVDLPPRRTSRSKVFTALAIAAFVGAYVGARLGSKSRRGLL